jgi:virulence-associated protein VagC
MKTAKLFATGGSQAVRLPKEFRFEGAEVYIFQEGNRVETVAMRVLQNNPDQGFPVQTTAAGNHPSSH